MAIPGGPGPSRETRASARELGGPDTLTSSSPMTDWPQQATEQIVRRVDWLRDTTTGKAVSAARVLVYGVVIVLLLTPLLIFLLVGSMRAFEGVLLWIASTWDLVWLTDPMWIVYLTFGSAFCFVGLWAWRKAKHPGASE